MVDPKTEREKWMRESSPNMRLEQSRGLHPHLNTGTTRERGSVRNAAIFTKDGPLLVGKTAQMMALFSFKLRRLHHRQVSIVVKQEVTASPDKGA